MERIQKYLSSCGVASRRKIEELLLNEKIKVNGEIVTELGFKVSGEELIEVDGKIVEKREDKVYYLLYKPEKTISSTSDDKGRSTVLNLIKTDKKIYPVGRLDYDTTGLLLLTNDGELSNKLLHPSREIEKEYYTVLIGLLRKEHIKALEKGIILDGSKTKPCKIKLKKYDKKTNRSYVNIILTEGRNHEVKNLFGFFDYRVAKLKRTRLSFLTLDNLKSGEYRTLTIKEIRKLYNEVK